MTRSILTALAAFFVVGAVSGTGCAPSGVGDPCTPEQEYDPTFAGFSAGEVSTESKSFQCLTRLCLVNHFQGLVSCPYGQGADGASPLTVNGVMTSPKSCPGNLKTADGKSPGCCTPGIPQVVTGPMNTQPVDETIKPQCKERTADQAVYCSCRCANNQGNTNDGAVYCTCPDGFTCTQLVSAIQSGGQNQGLTGAYCVKNGTQVDNSTGPPVCTPCDPTLQNCGSAT